MLSMRWGGSPSVAPPPPPPSLSRRRLGPWVCRFLGPDRHTVRAPQGHAMGINPCTCPWSPQNPRTPQRARLLLTSPATTLDNGRPMAVTWRHGGGGGGGAEGRRKGMKKGVEQGTKGATGSTQSFQKNRVQQGAAFPTNGPRVPDK